MSQEDLGQQLEHEAWKQNFIREIRERSAKSNSQLRREYAEREIQEDYESLRTGRGVYIQERYGGSPENHFLAYYHAHPDMGVVTLDDYFAYHAAEDAEMDSNMITSADLLDLHLSELRDFEEFGQGKFYSRRTERLLNRVIDGLIWGIDYEASRSKNPFQHIGLPSYKGKLLKAQSLADQMIVIHEVLNAIHQYAIGPEATGALLIVRDLRWAGREWRGAARKFLDFLRDELP